MNRFFVAGVDGGGTKTAAIIIDNQGRLLGAGEGGPSTYGVVPDDELRENLRAALSGALRTAGLSGGRLPAAFFGLGNIVSGQDRDAVRRLAAEIDGVTFEKIGVDHDCRAALAGGLSGRPGIVLIAGTGTSCFGMNARGESWRASGWGPLIDDVGSGYWLGIQAMRAATLDYDGRGAPTLLRQYVRERLGLDDLNELMNRLYAAGLSRTEIASLAPLVFAAADAGDAVAAGLIRAGCEAMAGSVLAVARRLQMDGPVELAVVGGLTRAGERLFAPLREAVHARLPDCAVMPAELPPAVGAAILALALCGQPASEAVLEKLRRSLPPAGS